MAYLEEIMDFVSKTPENVSTEERVKGEVWHRALVVAY